MKLRVLYFASARSIAGTSKEQIVIDGVPTLKDFVLKLQELHPGLAISEKSTRYAVNHELAEYGQVLREGDEVGVLPAVTGG